MDKWDPSEDIRLFESREGEPLIQEEAHALLAAIHYG